MVTLFLACRVLVYQFQPVAFDAAHEWAGNALEEGGPQIAVWLERPDASYLADVFLTARTATYGIGNRPGNSMFSSSPRFPYGARVMALPVWAWHRGHNYPQLVMQDLHQDSFRDHSFNSTLDNFYCRPLTPREIVDAVTCPTSFFLSDKGFFAPDGSQSLYPPRHDVAASQCKLIADGCRPNISFGCDSAVCPMLADLDDVATISGATPSPYAATPYRGLWHIPDALPDGDYVVFVEVAKQYDQDAPPCPSGSDADCPALAPHCDFSSHLCTRHASPFNDSYGIGANMGQPSVIWRLPITIDAQGAHVAVADGYAGYGDWDQPRGNLFPPDATISMTPGSGGARLARVTDGDGTWRVKLTARPCEHCDLPVPPPPLSDLSATAADSNLIDVSFANVAGAIGYEVRYVVGDQLDAAAFATATPSPPITPGPPGTKLTIALAGLLAQRTYAVGARADGDCATTSELRTQIVTTPRQKFSTVDGCFVATAAWGSPLSAEVGALRAFRDQHLRTSAVGRAAVRLYYGAGPPLARAIAPSPRARAAARAVLWPLVALTMAILPR